MYAIRSYYALADRFECWLLHGESGRPLALLDSAVEKDALTAIDRPTWYPGGAEGRRFVSEAGDIDDLTRLIRQAAGRRPTAVWIERHAREGVTGDGRRYRNETSYNFV